MNDWRGCKWYMVSGVWLLGALLSTSVWAARPGDVRALYSRGYKAFRAKQWKAAEVPFRRLLPLLKAVQQKRTKGSKAYHLMALGRCDVLFHLATIASRLKRERASCRLHQRLVTLRKSLPPTWRTWSIHPELPRRLDASASALSGHCATVPSEVTLQLSPPKARVALQLPSGQWIPIAAKRFSTRKKVLTLRFQAPGFKTLVVRNIKVPQWGALSLKHSLLKQPKARAIARIVPRPSPLTPPPPRASTPVYKTWWFWTLTGTLVVGAVTVGVIYAVRDRELSFREPDTNKPGFPVW